MKNFSVLFMLFFISFNFAQKPITKEGSKEIITSYITYFNQYDPLAPESVRRAKFNEIINKENPNLSQQDRKRAYAIVDTYIRADKGESINEIKLKESDINFIEKLYNDANKLAENGLQAMQNEVHKINKMTYEQYKNYVTQDGSIPLPEAEIQKAFNQMHQKDGKEVSITKTKKMDVNLAITIVQHPKKYSYTSFKKAMLFLKPTISEEEIQNVWKRN